jgi:hypothetical protein
LADQISPLAEAVLVLLEFLEQVLFLVMAARELLLQFRALLSLMLAVVVVVQMEARELRELAALVAVVLVLSVVALLVVPVQLPLEMGRQTQVAEVAVVDLTQALLLEQAAQES